MKNYYGMALWPFILHKMANPSIGLINHERIHLRQQLECLVLPFYLLYLGEYAWYRFRGLRHHEAYMNISFEREAYRFEPDLDYLRGKRKAFAWLKYWRGLSVK